MQRNHFWEKEKDEGLAADSKEVFSSLKVHVAYAKIKGVMPLLFGQLSLNLSHIFFRNLVESSLVRSSA